MFFSSRVSAFAMPLVILAFAVVTGCSPKIGGSCTVSTDCSAAGDRLCDITQPGGYCTEFNCEPDSCPDDALCINFGTQLSPKPGCGASQGNSPYQRSFCLATCESDGDCRSGYHCIDPVTVGGILVDKTRSGPVCGVKPTALESVDPDASDQVCLGSDAGIGSDLSSGGASASDASTGAAGASNGGASGVDSAGAGG